MGQKQKNPEGSKSNRTRQNNKRADRKVESNDSPEIPDRGETSAIPGLPSGPDSLRHLKYSLVLIIIIVHYEYDYLLGFLLLKDGHRTSNMNNELSVCCAHENETDSFNSDERRSFPLLQLGFKLKLAAFREIRLHYNPCICNKQKLSNLHLCFSPFSVCIS